MTTQDAAVTAAAEAACDGSHGWTQPCSLCVEFAERAVPKVRPIIEAEVLARIAVEERAVKHYRVGPARCACGYDAYKVGGFFPDYHAMFMAHLDDAARIARGTA